VGTRLPITLDLFLNNFTDIVLLISVMFTIKVVPSFLMTMRGLKIPQTIAMASLLSAPLTLVIAIMELGRHNGAVTDNDSAKMITAGILASLIFPSIARKLLKSSKVEDSEEAPMTIQHSHH
jgi:hypothetical protein